MTICTVCCVLQDSSGVPIMCAACSGGYPRLVQVLLDRGADLNARDPVGGS